MDELVFGDRLAAAGQIRLGCLAALFDHDGRQIFLTRRANNGQWCLPGGGVNPGESVAEACTREMREETCLLVQVRKLVGVYSNPHMLLRSPDKSELHLISLCFEVSLLDGEPTLTKEVTEWGWFGADALGKLDLMLNHRLPVIDAFERQAIAFVR